MSAAAINGLVLGFPALLLAVSAVTGIWPPPRRLTLKAEWVLCELAAHFQDELRRRRSGHCVCGQTEEGREKRHQSRVSKAPIVPGKGVMFSSNAKGTS